MVPINIGIPKANRTRVVSRLCAELGAVVLTLSIAVPPGETEVGLIAHLGVPLGAECTEQVNATELVNPFTAAMSNIEVAD